MSTIIVEARSKFNARPQVKLSQGDAVITRPCMGLQGPCFGVVAKVEAVFIESYRTCVALDNGKRLQASAVRLASEQEQAEAFAKSLGLGDFDIILTQ